MAQDSSLKVHDHKTGLTTTKQEKTGYIVKKFNVKVWTGLD
jgi:hypothetical protein